MSFLTERMAASILIERFGLGARKVTVCSGAPVIGTGCHEMQFWDRSGGRYVLDLRQALGGFDNVSRIDALPPEFEPPAMDPRPIRTDLELL